MLERKQIIKLFYQLNALLKEKGESGEIGLVGGAVMCLVYNARASTRDVDAIFEPAKIIRELAKEIAKNEGLPYDWLNDGAKGFLQSGFARQEVLALSHLNIWCPEPRYMLAMKCISARWDTTDREDVLFLISLENLTSAEDVFSIIENYYPKNQIPAKTQFFIEELFEEQ